MKILWTGDVHIRLKDDPRYTKDLLSALRFILEQCEVNKPDLLVITGDLFETKHPTTAEMSLATKIFRRVLDLGAEIIFFPGNHDNPANEDLYHNLKPLENLGVKGLHIIEEPGLYSIKGFDALILPYVYQNRTEAMQTVKAAHDAYTGDKLYFLGHFWVDGYLEVIPPSSEFIVPLNYLQELTKCKMFLLGHIHNAGNVAPGVYYCGSPYRTTWGDFSQTKYIYLITDGIVQPIVTPVYPIRIVQFGGNVQEMMNITNTMVKIVADQLPVEKLPELHQLQKDLESRGNYVKVDLKLHGVQLGENPDQDSPLTLDVFLDDYVKKNNLVPQQALITELCNQIVSGQITEDTHFSRIKELGLVEEE